MGVESVSVAAALSHADTLEISCYTPTRVLLPLSSGIHGKYNTCAYKISKLCEAQHVNYWERLHELKLYSHQRLRERNIYIYIYIYLEDNSIWCQILMVQWDTK